MDARAVRSHHDRVESDAREPARRGGARGARHRGGDPTNCSDLGRDETFPGRRSCSGPTRIGLGGRRAASETPLHIVAQFGPVEMVELLIRMKADVNATAYNGFTPLHLTEAKDIAALLIRAGADLYKRDNWDKTPLQAAAQRGKAPVVEAILESGYPCDLTSAVMLGKRELAIQLARENPPRSSGGSPRLNLWGGDTLNLWGGTRRWPWRRAGRIRTGQDFPRRRCRRERWDSHAQRRPRRGPPPSPTPFGEATRRSSSCSFAGVHLRTSPAARATGQSWTTLVPTPDRRSCRCWRTRPGRQIPIQCPACALFLISKSLLARGCQFGWHQHYQCVFFLNAYPQYHERLDERIITPHGIIKNSYDAQNFPQPQASYTSCRLISPYSTKLPGISLLFLFCHSAIF